MIIWSYKKMTRVSYIVSEYVCLTRGRAGACVCDIYHNLQFGKDYLFIIDTPVSGR